MRLGVFGGTFDPPHLGHVRMARAAYTQLRLDRVLWVVAGQPPHKPHQPLTPLPLRLALTEAAIAHQPMFTLSRVDADRPGPHWTADTLALLARRWPEAALFFILGADSLLAFPTWRQPQVILELARLAVVRRPGVTVTEAQLADLTAQLPSLRDRLDWVEAPPADVASSDIRARILSGDPWQHLVPAGVAALIQQHGLYRHAA